MFVKDGGDPDDNDSAGQLEFYQKNDADQFALYGKINVQSADVSDGTEDGTMVLSTMIDGTATDNLTIVGGNVGIGTVTAPHGGVGYAKLAIDGANGSSAGPHVQYTTAADDYPVFQQLNWSHDNIQLLFDAYYDGADKSSDAGSNFKILKSGDNLSFAYDSDISAGSALSWNTGFTMTKTGNIGIGDTDPSEAKLSITGVLSGDYGLKVTQAQNMNGIYIDNNGTASAMYIENTGSTGRGMEVYTNQGSGANSPLVEFRSDNAAFDQPVLKINNDGTGANAIYIDSEATTQHCMSIDNPANTSGDVLRMYDCDGLTTGSALNIETGSTNLASTATGGLVQIISSGNTSTNANNLLFIQNNDASSSGTKCLFIDQNGDNNAIDINSICTTKFGMLVQCDTLTTGKAGYFYSNCDDNSTRNLVQIENDHASADNAVGLYIHQDGDDAHIEFAGAGGGGIKFNASAMTSSDPNTLDDYEEGDYDLTVTGSGGSAFTLSGSEEKIAYTKVGRVCHVQGAAQIDGDSGASGTCQFSLPFASASMTDHSGRTYGTAFLLNAGSTLAGKIVVHVPEGSNHFVLVHISDDGATYDNIDVDDVDASWFIGFTFSYIPA